MKITNVMLLEEMKLSRENKNIPTAKLLEAFQVLASRIIIKKGYQNMTYKGDLVAEAIEHQIKCWKRFDPTKSQNPFAYLHQCINCGALCAIATHKRKEGHKPL